jgi:hypothetical protein
MINKKTFFKSIKRQYDWKKSDGILLNEFFFQNASYKEAWEKRRLGGGSEKVGLSIQILQDVFCEQSLRSVSQTTSLRLSLKILQSGMTKGRYARLKFLIFVLTSVLRKIVFGTVHIGRLLGRFKKFAVCMVKEKTKEDKRCKTSEGWGVRSSNLELSKQMLQDVLCEKPLFFI